MPQGPLLGLQSAEVYNYDRCIHRAWLWPLAGPVNDLQSISVANDDSPPYNSPELFIQLPVYRPQFKIEDVCMTLVP